MNSLVLSPFKAIVISPFPTRVSVLSVILDMRVDFVNILYVFTRNQLFLTKGLLERQRQVFRLLGVYLSEYERKSHDSQIAYRTDSHR